MEVIWSKGLHRRPFRFLTPFCRSTGGAFCRIPVGGTRFRRKGISMLPLTQFRIAAWRAPCAMRADTRSQTLDRKQMTDLYAVIGNPIAHSKSPSDPRGVRPQTGRTCAMNVPGTWKNSTHDVDQFREDGGRGLNVTVPFRERAFRLAGPLSDRARAAGAVNTLVVRDDGTYGDNTDGVGLVRDLGCNHLFDFGGAGPAARCRRAVRGVLRPLLGENPGNWSWPIDGVEGARTGRGRRCGTRNGEGCGPGRTGWASVRPDHQRHRGGPS